MVSGTSVKITNVSQVKHASQDCLATAVKKRKKILQPVCSSRAGKLLMLPPSGKLALLDGGEPALRMIKDSLLNSVYLC